MDAIGDRIKQIRKANKLSQNAFADKLEVSQGFIGHIENGRNRPGADFLINLATVFNCDIHWVLTGEGKMTRAVRLAESAAHQALKKRLGDLVRSPTAILGYGMSFDTYRAYLYGDYLPTQEELNVLCRIAGDWTFETGTMSTKDEEASAEIEKRVQEAITLHKMNSRVDIELLKEVTTEIEGALFSSAIKLDPARKAELLALVYDYASESESNRSDVKGHVKRLLRLIRD